MFAPMILEDERLFRHSSRRKSKDYSCQFCQRRFSKSYNLMIHERSHLIEQNFSCDICGKSFKKQEYLKQHRSQHSPSNYSPPNSFY